MRTWVIPFARATDDDIWFSTPWQIVRDGASQSLGEFISDWDCMSQLRFTAEVRLNLTSTYSNTHQGKSAQFAMVVSAASNTTRMRGPIWSADLPQDELPRLSIDTELSGYELGGRLDLLTTLILTNPDPTDAIGASVQGAILWQNRHPVALEGDATRFPTESADLSQAPYNCPRAGWRLETDADDLDAIAAATVRLLVNHSHPVMKTVLEGVDSPEATAAMRAMRWDVARQLVDVALDSDEFIERYGSFEEDTLGWTLTNVLRAHFPGETASSLRAMRHLSPAEFESKLQDAAGILG